MITLNVALGDRSYPIYIGSNLLDRAALIQQHLNGKEVLVVSNETVAPLYLETLMASLAGYRAESVILPDGEKYKTLEQLNNIFTALLEKRMSRQTTIIALGGGVIGDMAGFAAACYQRGIPFIQVPTTLLAQVDSSVGGKTAVNHPAGKNMIGAFYQPKCVIADTSVFSTLDDRQLSAGIAEVIKYGLIRDELFLRWLEENMDALVGRDADALVYAIERSCLNKAEVVAADEHERGQRALLNLGHTFGHAIETAMGYGEWLHGEAVAAGMYMAADLSARLGWLARADVERLEKLLKRANLPVKGPRIGVEKMKNLMAVDKKVMDGQIRLVLLKAMGEAVVTDEFDAALLDQTLQQCQV
ncbi:MAG TPA: 3-dehydroquinate synthase [Candidatus Tenderia electrophaga]|uniref:3-dehydroquinate synthase n=1 Tax=Candidatus Tenderia electrophaga TaxID=1748243 RepID=A0A832J2W4_9GAMM|nr:3-dehydroquinate synthase [Candidatus Tenderia electrophaga]